MGAAVAPRARRYFWRAETGPAWTRWPSKMKVTKEQMIATMASLNFLKVPALVSNSRFGHFFDAISASRHCADLTLEPVDPTGRYRSRA
jgi:hypothetical protein